jgi:hypothetical protein
MPAYSLSRGPSPIRLTVLLFALLSVCGCSKSEKAAARDVPSPVALTTPSRLVPPNRPTAAERMVEIDRILATPLTGTPQGADERTLLRAERAALISSGQVSYQSVNQAMLPQPSANGGITDYARPTTDSPNGQIVIAPNSQASSLPFLEQMTPTERAHYFQALRLQNSSLIYVNAGQRFNRDRNWGWSGRRSLRP